MAFLASAAPCRGRRTRIVDAFNVLDEKRECIETTGREEVIQRIEELASLVGLKNTNEKLTGHRDW